ncbi:helix-turn-helix domain-containing protein [Bacteroides mediterraneensis]|uniref:Helix-turn-helix transcriptional regulator n=1 Tax=Bacteroides mediterraneensis TaxID=1841856 RepID=A0ABS2ESW5_9BACE|nr:AraC family transcriptional regulator [Bacteroides mediterraneensis]MBM6757631.1 helix-turn-helix transcriptional regulator [Bacteroides mediterraneensis]MBM6780310.1 helix-turn-helix transcriptional regulator [Bacteroides mediterraneensis]
MRKNEVIKTRLAEWINQKGYLNSRITIIQLSKIIGVNRTYLSNHINTTYGTNFNLWINRMRIAEAKQLIKLSPKRNLSEIAAQIGFTDLAHFSKQFKLQEGVTPSEWRKNI